MGLASVGTTNFLSVSAFLLIVAFSPEQVKAYSSDIFRSWSTRVAWNVFHVSSIAYSDDDDDDEILICRQEMPLLHKV